MDLSNYAQSSKLPIELMHTDMIRRVLPRGRIPHVCIVGAGMAGLRCAEVLLEKGIQVTILEGRDRIGGRVHQSNHLGHMVDMGPNWIHGTDHNPILDLAKETHTAACSTGEGACVFDEVGKLLDGEKANAISELVWGTISDAFKLSNDELSVIPPNISLKDFFIEKLNEKGLSQTDEKLVLQMAEMWGAFIGDPWDRQSLKYFWLEECIDGENLFVASTYKAILSRVARSALSKADVRLSTKVLSVENSSDTTEEKVIVKTNDHSFEFDEVVVTAPLGCLKRNVPSFSPPLSPRITRAISNISYGRLEKVYLTFPTAFWDPPPNDDSPTSNQIPPASKSTIKSTPPTGLSSLPQSSPNSLPDLSIPNPSSNPIGTPSRGFPFFTHFLHPAYTPSNPLSWNIELVSLSSSVLSSPNSHTTHPTLLFYIHSPCATHITSLTASLAPTSPDYFTALNTFFAPYYSLLPNYTPASASCTPTAILATNWQTDPLAGHGSYTNFQISDPVGEGEDEVKLDEDIEALRRGMPERRVWLAGEHTAPFVALGTVTGAWWSGDGGGEGGMVKVVKGKMEAGDGADGGRLNGVAL